MLCSYGCMCAFVVCMLVCVAVIAICVGYVLCAFGKIRSEVNMLKSGDEITQ